MCRYSQRSLYGRKATEPVHRFIWSETNDTKKKGFFPKRNLKEKLLWQAVDALSLEVFEARLDGALSNLI